MTRQQAQAIDYLFEESRILRELLGQGRPRLNDDQRRRLAAKGRAVGRRALGRIATIVTPDTILRWHRQLIAAKHTHPARNRVGRPGLMQSIRALIVRMATDNSSWGYCRIQGELRKLGHRVAPSTIANTLKANGIAPSQDRPTSWVTFLKAHADAIAATDFFTADVWTTHGLVTHHVLFVIHHATRIVEIAGITTNPNADFMAQVARNLTDSVDGFLRDKRFLILDRDTKFTEQFARIIGDAGVAITPTAIQAPNMNAIAERFASSVKRECLTKMILFGEAHLRRALAEFVAHYNAERPHQGIGNEIIQPPAGPPPATKGEVVADERLDGLFRSYRRAA
ncbi:MAG: integrase core domain-containing protein [bacterium]|nr:integrase core domain-containing protein [bacterium]